MPDHRNSLVEIHRILRDGGLFFCFNLPYFLSWTQRISHLRGNYYHDRLYRKAQVAALMAQGGFDLLDMWHRQLFPKNSVRYPRYHFFERVDQFLTEYTAFRYLATNIEFVAAKTGTNPLPIPPESPAPTAPAAQNCQTRRPNRDR